MRLEHSPYGHNVRGVSYSVWVRNDEQIDWLYYMTADGTKVIYGYSITKVPDNEFSEQATGDMADADQFLELMKKAMELPPKQ